MGLQNVGFFSVCRKELAVTAFSFLKREKKPDNNTKICFTRNTQFWCGKNFNFNFNMTVELHQLEVLI